MQHELIGSLGSGSAIVEMAFALAGLPVQLTDLPYNQPGPRRDRLLALNPLGQVPVLVLPGGAVMTESAAMILYLDGLAPAAGLLPAGAGRPAALNLLVQFVAALYPTVTFSDRPEEWAGPGAPAAFLRARLAARMAGLWRRIEAAAPPDAFFGGARPGALDLYLAVMTRWRPGPEWFARKAPRLARVGLDVASDATLAGIMARHFP